MCPNYHTLEAGDATTRNAAVFWRSNRHHYLLVLVIMRALAMSIHVRTYLPKSNN